MVVVVCIERFNTVNPPAVTFADGEFECVWRPSGIERAK